mmetsp:Transcript_10188/g.15603  ORF Transcript_10188/g.15603 Transcript_10188/m.15603 type:complete len:221 (+) Transcript_10188:586-1248(+)
MRTALRTMTDMDLQASVSERLLAARSRTLGSTDRSHSGWAYKACAPVGSQVAPYGCAVLVGLSSLGFGWDVQSFLSSCELDQTEWEDAEPALDLEYKSGGFNSYFRSVMQGPRCIVGRASTLTEKASLSLGLGVVPLGGSSGLLDCNVGGTQGICSEICAMIQHVPSEISQFQFSACNDEDVVTLNGKRITLEMGPFPLLNEDVCSVGARVFVFLLPQDE